MKPTVSAFWVVTSLFAAAALYFTIAVEARRVRFTDDIDLRSGDRVTVKRLLDGDELEVSKGDGVFAVRILGLKCFEPDVNEPGISGQGQACKSELKRLLATGPVSLHYEGTVSTDGDDRVLAYVHAGKLDVGLTLVEEGYGMAFTKYAFSRETAYITAQSGAQRALRGLWGRPRPRARAEALIKQWDVERSNN